MNKIQFENEEQAKDFYLKSIGYGLDCKQLALLKQKSYIKKSELEIAGEEYEKFCNKCFSRDQSLDSSYADYIDELEKEIERLRNRKNKAFGKQRNCF